MVSLPIGLSGSASGLGPPARGAGVAAKRAARPSPPSGGDVVWAYRPRVQANGVSREGSRTARETTP